MLALSATPYRRDKLNKLIYLTLGNMAAEVKESELQATGARIKPEVIARETSFYYPYEQDSDYQPMISALVEDRSRNQLIASDVAQEYRANGNYCLVLSDRKAHCESLAAILQDFSENFNKIYFMNQYSINIRVYQAFDHAND